MNPIEAPTELSKISSISKALPKFPIYTEASCIISILRDKQKAQIGKTLFESIENHNYP